MARVFTDREINDIIKAYESLESCKSIATRYEVSRTYLNKVLIQHGVAIRNRSAGMYARMALTTPEERLKLSEKAHDAVRGKTNTIETLIDKAKVREKTMQYVGKGEDYLFDLMCERGLVARRQMACERYNIDFAFPPVAVELLFHSSSPFSREPDRKKIEYLTKNGWAVLYIRLAQLSYLCERHADYAVSFVDEVGRNPALIGEYRVIGRTCNLEASGRFYTNDVT